MPQSAHSACVRCHKHLLEGCGRTDGFWQSSRKNCQGGFHKSAHRAFARKPSVRPPHGVKPRTAGSDHQSMQPLWTSRSQMHQEPSAPSGARFESAPRRLERRTGRCDAHQQMRPGWLAWAALIFAEHITALSLSLAMFAISSLY